MVLNQILAVVHDRIIAVLTNNPNNNNSPANNNNKPNNNNNKLGEIPSPTSTKTLYETGLI